MAGKKRKHEDSLSQSELPIPTDSIKQENMDDTDVGSPKSIKKEKKEKKKKKKKDKDKEKEEPEVQTEVKIFLR